MFNLNELAFEAMLGNMRWSCNGNPFAALFLDCMSYGYNRQKYNDSLCHIIEENNQIGSIYNQVSMRGGLVFLQEQFELQRHIQLRSEYETKSVKHLMSGGRDVESIVSKLIGKKN